VFSGGTVAIGLLSLVLLPAPALRSIGVGGMLVPAVSVAVTVTLLPVRLATRASRLNGPAGAGPRPAAAVGCLGPPGGPPQGGRHRGRGGA
jgi:RND superfamily putative drug exporter